MKYERKEDLAIYYWLQDLFTGKSVTIVDGFPEEILSIPTVAVDWDETENIERELGTRRGSRLRTWFIDIFAKNKSQRDEIAYDIYDALKNGITVYDIVGGVPSTTEIGHLNVIQRRNKRIDIDPELVSPLYYRARITILTENDKPQEE